MRFLIIILLSIILVPAAYARVADSIVEAAHDRTKQSVRYDPAYVSLTYPGGDVADDTGVCTDVIIRAYRAGLGFDFQRAVHEDMKANFSEYPKIWTLKRPDKNIDHRRVPNLQKYLTRQGASLGVSDNKDDFLPGDLVTWMVAKNLPHIGIVSDNVARDGTPLIIHNIGAGPQEENILFKLEMTGHYRFHPAES